MTVVLAAILLLVFAGPTTARPEVATTSLLPAAEGNPPATGFDRAGSDPRAIEIADEVMLAMGGRGAWDSTQHLRWRFFGRRLHVWNKQTGDIRIEGIDRDDGENWVVLMNLYTKQGRAWKAGQELTDGQELADMLDRGEAAWINDSYWMFMPYKLKDSGVTLRHAGEGVFADGQPADVLELTFKNVGRTPENKYRVYVSRDRRLVEQWDFFADAADSEPQFSTPWSNWQRFGSILLSDGRGDSRHTDLAVFDSLPESVYRDPSPVDWSSMR
ncbi:MAG: hypothetical protein OEM62_02960 [Acidobacteriota bacterium]|nr:hypothetical protein [Acidobacteriota bacterium]